jgi:hypothetical protein
MNKGQSAATEKRALSDFPTQIRGKHKQELKINAII